MTPKERAECLVFNHDLAPMLNSSDDGKEAATRLIAEAIEAAVLEEREACTKIADEFYDRDERVDTDTAAWKVGDWITEAIRQRGQQ